MNQHIGQLEANQHVKDVPGPIIAVEYLAVLLDMRNPVWSVDRPILFSGQAHGLYESIAVAEWRNLEL